MTQSDSVKWKNYNRKRSTMIQSKKPFQKRMEEEMELEKKVEEEKEESYKSFQSSFLPRINI
jgi:hypothetical protein